MSSVFQQPVIRVHHEVTSSTMTAAAEAARQYTGSIVAVTTTKQLSGRGSGNRKWECPVGNVFLTVAVPQAVIPPAALPMLPLVTGLAMQKAVKVSLPPAEAAFVKAKWPNDTLYRKQKIAGCIIEPADDAFLFGIGINVAHAPSTPAAAGARPATSVADIISGKAAERGGAGAPLSLEAAVAAAEEAAAARVAPAAEAVPAADVPPAADVAAACVEELVARLAQLVDRQDSSRVISDFSAQMEWEVPVHKRMAVASNGDQSGRGPPLRPVRLDEWGHLVAVPWAGGCGGTPCEVVLSSEYLY